MNECQIVETMKHLYPKSDEKSAREGPISRFMHPKSGYLIQAEDDGDGPALAQGGQQPAAAPAGRGSRKKKARPPGPK